MKMIDVSKLEFISDILRAQHMCIDAIQSLNNTDKLADILKRTDIDFYDVWTIVYDKLDAKSPFIITYNYFISINPGNAFAERQGRIMNLVRDKWQHKMKMLLLNSKMSASFNVPMKMLYLEKCDSWT
eukprot:473198_1